MTSGYGLAGRLAQVFAQSKLTPLIIGAALVLGLFAAAAVPREEEPQIVVPMVDVFIDLPGASPAEVEQRVTRPIEQRLWEIPGLEYLYSTSSAGRAMFIARFEVGEDEERAVVRLHHKLAAALDRLPEGVAAPQVRVRFIDDVPVMALTLWGERYDDAMLRILGMQLQEALKEVPNVSEVTVLGGRPRQATVELDPAALSARGLAVAGIHQAMTQANARVMAGELVSGNASVRLSAGGWPEEISELRGLVVGQAAGPVRLGDVATVALEAGEPTDYVFFHPGPGQSHPAVTLGVAKRRGTNAVDLTRAIDEKLATLRGTVLPDDVQVAVTRNYGETAQHKSNELLMHMVVAVVSVSLLIGFALGRRESLVVMTAIPVTLALTLFVFYLYGYTLNRITLFALIFSIGILVDDAIVVVENVVRHVRLAGQRLSMQAIALMAVDEVGNPTILATFTVVAAILPMAFVGGLMGPYMRPIPVGATAAMLFSLVVAFIVTPWAAIRWLRSGIASHEEQEDRMTAAYRRFMAGLIRHPRQRTAFLLGVAVFLIAALMLVPTGLVTVKMLPFDNKNELQVVVRMPEGTPLETTAGVVTALADIAMSDTDVRSAQSYIGTSSPYTFNGLVRHYFLRAQSHLGDIQVLLTDKGDRSVQSHDIARRLRERLGPEAARLGAIIQVVEIPPGPPVLQTLVAEVYGPDAVQREGLAAQVREVFRATSGVVDVDWYVESPRTRIEWSVDSERAAMAGISAADVRTTVQVAVSGAPAGLLHSAASREPVPVVLRLPRPQRAKPDAVAAVPVASGVPLGSLVRAHTTVEPQSIYHKNLQPVTYVTGDVAGAVESPVYAIFAMNRLLSQLTVPGGTGLELFNMTQPFDSARYAMKWDGEWHITLEVFRDLGIAFAAVLVLIYILVVGWFQSFVTPLTIMLAIPFSLVGILPAHAAMGAFFTATSMIGFIAGAGIVVRNSIILVDFIELRVRDGMPLEQAVVDAGAVRFRPMALTAAAVIVGSAVMLFDPIFQGLAISLMAGEVASLLLSRMTVPITYFLTHQHRGAVE